MELETVNDVSTEMETSTPALEVSSVGETSVGLPVGDSLVTAPVTPDNAATPEVPAYQPNFKYSVRGQEKEIDEMFRPLVKDAESEKKLKELFERAEGLDFVKQDRATLKQEHEGFKTQVTPYLQEYHKFTTLRDKGNLGAALQVAGITDDQIFEYAVQRLEMEKNPHHAQTFQRNNESAIQAMEMEGQLQRYQQMEQSIQKQQFDYNLSNAIGAHTDLVSQIEGKWGKPGSFKEEVINLGIAEYNRGVQLTEQQAVEAIVNKYKPFLAPSTPSASSAPVAHKAPATIPNVGSASISPIRKQPNSLADLKKAYQDEVG